MSNNRASASRAKDGARPLAGRRRITLHNYRAALDHGLPGAFEQAVADADAFFTQELPALWQWPFTEDDAHRIQQPALAVLGTASPAIFAERHKLLLHWLPNAEPLELPGLTHLLHAQDPAAVADGLTGFFARHPIPEPL